MTSACILIVDDEIQNRRLLEVLLHPEGYRTVSVGSGAEALAAVAAEAPDLILLDVMMPGMDGYQVASALKADSATASIPIIMVSALLERTARVAGLEAGAEEFLGKPVDRAELWLRVRNLLRLKAYADLLEDHGRMLEQQVQSRTLDLQRFRTAMDATADAILLLDRDSMRFVEVNATACVMLGYTRGELLQLKPHLLWGHEDDVPSAAEDLRAEFDAIIAGVGSGDLIERELRRRDGSTLRIEMHRQAQRFGDAWIIVDVLRDISEREQARERLHQLAHYDALTGLPNRRLFQESLELTLAQAPTGEWTIAVLCIDLDHFKNVNDTLGHAMGDELLRQFAGRLVDCVRVRDTVGRLGGDDFALIVAMHKGQEAAGHVAAKIVESLRTPFDLKGHPVSMTASIGIAVHPFDAGDAASLIKYADTAMYSAKQAGRNTFRYFTAEMNAEILARLALESAVREAVERNEFVVYYQPMVRLDSGRIAGLEALLRWQRPGHGLVLPSLFIPVLESTGLIVAVSRWVIHQVCAQIGAWNRSAIGPVRVSINVSDRQFVEDDLEATVIDAVLAHAISADQIELELTETTMMVNTERTVASLRALKAHGVRIAVDDFGTGYSSLAYLRRFPIDKLKIDIDFIRDICNSADDAAIVVAIVQMAHGLKLEVVAEGVETAAQLSSLLGCHCDYIQGYHVSFPLPALEIQQLLSEDQRLGLLAPESDLLESTMLRVAGEL